MSVPTTSESPSLPHKRPKVDSPQDQLGQALHHALSWPRRIELLSCLTWCSTKMFYKKYSYISQYKMQYNGHKNVWFQCLQ